MNKQLKPKPKWKIERENQILDRLLIIPLLILVFCIGVTFGILGIVKWFKAEWIPIETVKANEIEDYGIYSGFTEYISNLDYESIDVVEVERVEVEEVQEEIVECPYTYEELMLLSRLVYCEVGNCSDETVLYYTASVVLNRVDSVYFPNSIESVIYQSGQYSVTWDGSMSRKEPDDRTIEIVEEVLVKWRKEGETFLPSNVLGQTGFVVGYRGWSTYEYIDGVYFSSFNGY